MIILNNPCLILSTFFVVCFYCINAATPNIVVGKKTAAVFMLLFDIALATTAALIEPKATFDLTRYYEDLDMIRSSGMDFWKFVFHSDLITSSNYKYMLVFNAYRYIISKHFSNNALPFFTVFISLLILTYILIDSTESRDIQNYRIGGSLGLFFSYMHFLFLYSGIRNGLAAAVAALGLYMIYYKGRSFTCLILLLISGLIHPVVLIVIPVIAISWLRPKAWYCLLAFFVQPVLSVGSRMLMSSEIGFLRMIGTKYYNYTNIYNFYSGKVFTAAPLVACLIVLVLAFAVYKYNDKENNFFINFIVWYICIDLCFLSNQQIFMRLGYTTAYLSPLIIDWIARKEDSDYWPVISLACYSIVVLLGAYMCYKSAQWML